MPYIQVDTFQICYLTMALINKIFVEFLNLNIHNPKAPCKVSNYKIYNFKAIRTVYGQLKGLSHGGKG